VSSHILLKIEVSKLLALLQLQELKKLGVGVNLATIVLVLKLLVANVGIHLASNLSAGTNTALGLAKKSSQLVRDEGRLDETRRSTVSVGLAALVGLISGTKLTSVLTLQLVDLRANGGKNRLSTLELGKDAAVESSANSTIDLNGDGG
jgi:hypothetical protein